MLPVHPTNPDQMQFSLHSAGQLDLFPLQQCMDEFEQALNDKGFRKEYYSRTDRSFFTKQRHILAVNKMETFINNGKVPCHRNAAHCIEDAIPSIGSLDLYGLKDRLPELQKHMEDKQYSSGYIRKVIIKAERIIVLSGSVEWNSCQDIIDWYDGQRIMARKSVPLKLTSCSACFIAAAS